MGIPATNRKGKALLTILAACLTASVMMAVVDNTQAHRTHNATQKNVQRGIARSVGELPPEIRNFGGGRTCAANPWRAGCPKVKEVHFSVPTDVDAPPVSEPTSETVDPSPPAEDEATNFGPVLNIASGEKASAAGHPAGFACGVYANYPEFYFADNTKKIRASGVNHCTGNASNPVTFTQVDEEMRRYDGGWATLRRDNHYIYGPGYAVGRTYYDCNHSRILTYRSHALGYSVVRGVGYSGVNYKDTAGQCIF